MGGTERKKKAEAREKGRESGLFSLRQNGFVLTLPCLELDLPPESAGEKVKEEEKEGGHGDRKV